MLYGKVDMVYFRRVLGYVTPQYKAVILSVLCALVVAMLFTLSIGALLPLMKVIIGEEGLHGWVERAVIKHRCGISFAAQELQETLTDNKETSSRSDETLAIVNLRNDSPAKQGGLEPGDIILAVNPANLQSPEEFTREQLLTELAWADPTEPLHILARHTSGEIKTLTIETDNPPIYASSARWLLDFVPREHGVAFKRNCIILVVVIILAATITRCLLRFLQEYLIRRVSFSAIMMLRAEAYHNALRLPMNFFSKDKFSDVISRFVQDSNRINIGITTLFGKTVREPLKLINLAVLAFALNSTMTFIVITGAPVAAVIISRLGKKMKKVTRRSLESWAKILGHLQGTLFGIRVVKGYHQENNEEKSFNIIHHRLLKQQFRAAKIEAASGPLLESISIIAACIGMIFASFWLTKGDMETSVFFILVMTFATMAESGRKLGNVYPRLQVANASAQRVYQLIDNPTETDPPAAKELPRHQHSLEFKNVNFRYPNSETQTLVNINLRVKAGDSIAIVGPNGSGKTTLVSLLPRFFDPDKGSIYIDGQNIADVTLRSLRQQFGIVNQQTIVFNDTIAANIAYADPDADTDRIITASRKAYAHEFIEATPKGYDTIIGEQGSTLSGGQLQRIAIARAILHDPAILIFDEATSQIDTDSEAKIQQAIHEFARGRTSFIIAHRLSTITGADRIVVMDQGRIIAEGKHQELLKICELYRQLFEIQFVAERENDKMAES